MKKKASDKPAKKAKNSPRKSDSAAEALVKIEAAATTLLRQRKPKTRFVPVTYAGGRATIALSYTWRVRPHQHQPGDVYCVYTIQGGTGRFNAIAGLGHKICVLCPGQCPSDIVFIEVAPGIYAFVGLDNSACISCPSKNEGTYEPY